MFQCFPGNGNNLGFKKFVFFLPAELSYIAIFVSLQPTIFGTITEETKKAENNRLVSE